MQLFLWGEGIVHSLSDKVFFHQYGCVFTNKASQYITIVIKVMVDRAPIPMRKGRQLQRNFST